jgi:hypothetical protein
MFLQILGHSFEEALIVVHNEDGRSRARRFQREALG